MEKNPMKKMWKKKYIKSKANHTEKLSKDGKNLYIITMNVNRKTH